MSLKVADPQLRQGAYAAPWLPFSARPGDRFRDEIVKDISNSIGFKVFSADDIDEKRPLLQNQMLLLSSPIGMTASISPATTAGSSSSMVAAGDEHTRALSDDSHGSERAFQRARSDASFKQLDDARDPWRTSPLLLCLAKTSHDLADRQRRMYFTLSFRPNSTLGSSSRKARR